MASPSRGPSSFRDVTNTLDSDLPSTSLNVLFASVGLASNTIVTWLLPQIGRLPDVSLRAVLDTSFCSKDWISASGECLTYPNVARRDRGGDATDIEQEAAELCAWADLLVLAPIDAHTLSRMLHGQCDNLLLEVLRGWNVSKKILLKPGMSTDMWEHPMTKKQLTKIRRKWNWVQVLQPVLWTFEGDVKRVPDWKAVTDDLLDAMRNQIDLKNIGKDVEVSPQQKVAVTEGKRLSSRLPPELWTMIFDFTGDWELAQTMHVYTNLPHPPEWRRHMSAQGPRGYMEALEYNILRGDLADVKHFIATHSVPRWLSKLCVRVIMRFAMTPLLAHLEANHKDLFWATFGHTFLPDKASSVFGRTEILEFWRTSPSFLTKEYNNEALDGASRAGFVNVLEWWQHSGLPLKFSEAALEQASSQGHVAVLDWWQEQSTAVDDTAATVDASKIRLKPGKSICFAAQNGHVSVVAWWLNSGIPFSHEDTVAKLASTHGHTAILQLWHTRKGSKMIFDNQVLVGATKMGNVDVLEWWKRSGLKVEYKTCDVEEALEDGCEGEKGLEVRRWWARNGLNLGVGTSEWMKTKVLNA